MDVEFKHTLSESEREEVAAFQDSLTFAALEQYPDWGSVVEFSGRVCHFTARESGVIVCYALVFERLINVALVEFGPLGSDPKVLAESIRHIHNHYRRRGFLGVHMQPSLPAGEPSAILEREIRGYPELVPCLRRGDQWCTLVIDMRQDVEQIYKRFSKGHRSAIRRAAKEGMIARPVQDEGELHAFLDIFVKMHRARRLHLDVGPTRHVLARLWVFLSDRRMGHFLIVTDSSGKVYGGIVIARQGRAMRYYKGAADPDQRHRSLLHTALSEGIRMAGDAGVDRFDLWGYNPRAQRGDQQYGINTFKKGFGGEPLCYTEPIDLVIRPVRYRLVNTVWPLLKPCAGLLRPVLKPFVLK
ncbi:MAG: peptidoglycan bridge formation glycyltransferase FemA/FemB family protein [Chitinivibrionales bacterium]|nr:peptidoglycan bridge formation glycyltransferase FemA/FemB family protein [Chitinivibrionales bacterium]MBD3396210.1 peptidoglycan bridge formation glycyltransferase FemA/FemB family protein [Chitinivibrionales bacterium]